MSQSSKKKPLIEYKTVAFDYSLPGSGSGSGPDPGPDLDIGESVAGPSPCCPACAADAGDDGLSDMELKSVRLKRDARFRELFHSLRRAQELGLNYKVWRTVGGSDVRDSHKAAHNQTVRIDEMFTVGGEELFLPADPNASFAETANCRCDVKFLRLDNTPFDDADDSPENTGPLHRFERDTQCDILNDSWQFLMDAIDQEYEKLDQISAKTEAILENADTRIINALIREKDELVKCLAEMAVSRRYGKLPIPKNIQTLADFIGCLGNFLSGLLALKNVAKDSLIADLNGVKLLTKLTHDMISDLSTRLNENRQKFNDLGCRVIPIRDKD